MEWNQRSSAGHRVPGLQQGGRVLLPQSAATPSEAAGGTRGRAGHWEMLCFLKQGAL